MVFKKIPLKQLVSQHMRWSEFVRIAQMPKGSRPSYRSLHLIFGPDGRTFKTWFRRWDGGERE